MAQSNRVAFLINTITNCQRLATRGMGESGRAIDRSLKGYILATETAWSQATEKVADDPITGTDEFHVDIGLLAGCSPLNRGKSSSHKAEYAHILVANVITHLNYLGIAVTVIMRDLKAVLLTSRCRSRNQEQQEHQSQREQDRIISPIIDCRPHPFGGVEPPSIDDVTQTLKDIVDKLDIRTTLDTESITIALEALDEEHRAFHRENVLNNAFIHAEVESTTMSGETFNGTFVLPDNYKNWQNVALDTYSVAQQHPFVNVHPGVIKRGPNDSTSWRPKKHSPDNPVSVSTDIFPFLGLWGSDGQGVDRDTLLDFLCSVVAPYASLAATAAIITCHLRRHLECMSAILFSRATGLDDGLDICEDLPDGYETWPVWQRLKRILDWFTLLWRMIIYSHEITQEALTDNKEALTTLAALLESWHPVFFSDEWLYDSLLGQWPKSTRELSDPVTVAGLISTAIVIPPGYPHPVFGKDFINDTSHSLWHRLSFDSAIYLCSAVLGRAKQEESAGTLMLVGRQPDSHQQKPNDNSNDRILLDSVLLPVKHQNITSKQRHDDSNQNPFLLNPLYRTKIVWTGDTGEHLLTCTELLNECLTAMDVILQRGRDQKTSEWMTLRLFAFDEIEATVGVLWKQLLRRYTANIRMSSEKNVIMKRLLSNVKEKNDNIINILGKAAQKLDGGLAEAVLRIEKDEKTLAAINNRRLGSARAAETALFEVATWTSATDAIMEAVASFPTLLKELPMVSLPSQSGSAES
nr:MAG: wsv220-like protein [Penaeus semisulcatus pemonivirus]